MKASRCACNSINVKQIYVSTIYFILKQDYVFRLKNEREKYLIPLRNFTFTDIPKTEIR